MPPPDFVERRQPGPACEAHSVAIAVLQSNMEDLKDDLGNHKRWRIAVEDKLDRLKASIHLMELRLYAVVGGIAALAWAWEHWFTK